MKIRNGFVSNSSSSSFIISGEYDAEKILKFAKEQSYKSEIKSVVDYTLFDGYSKYNKKSRPIVERIEHAKKSLDRIACEYNEKELDENIKITTVGEMKRSNNSNSDFDIEDWYGNTISNFADTDLVLYDSYDNYIPYDAGEKIIKKFNPIDYNTHMG